MSITIASAAAESHADKKQKSIAKLKKRSAKIAAQLQRTIQPLNNRINPQGMMVWWDGEDYVINTNAADRSIGTEFRLDDHCLAQLMAMSDRKLATFLKGF